MEKGLHLGVQHWAGLVEVEGGVEVEDEGVDVSREATTEGVELDAEFSNKFWTWRGGDIPQYNY